MVEVSFSEAIQRKYAEWVVLIATIDEDGDEGRANVMPAGWTVIASHNPPLYAVILNQACYTLELIHRHKAFVVGFPGPGLEAVIKYTGSCSGWEVKDKFRQAGLKPLPAKQVKPPLISGCIVNLECQFESELAAGDHTIVVGRVVAAHIDEQIPGRLLNFGQGQFVVALPLGYDKDD